MKKEKLIGVYCYTNLLNSKKYIGCSNDIYKRWNQHTKDSLIVDERRIFYKAIRKYGLSNFKIEILELCDEIFLKIREDFYIDLFNTTNMAFGYNIEKGYNTISFNPNKIAICENLKQKAINRRWINNSIKNITVDKNDLERFINLGWVIGRLKFSNEHKKALSVSHKGYIMSDVTKINLSNAIKGRKLSESAIQNIKKGKVGTNTLEWYIKKHGNELGTIKYNNHYKIKHTKNKICINNKIVSKFISPSDLPEFISKGWVKGKLKYNTININKGKICIHNNELELFINPSELEQYLKNNWIKGRLKKYKNLIFN